jgi:radical SAM superfamily enzyme YgiQ (UPF0313 family)
LRNSTVESTWLARSVFIVDDNFIGNKKNVRQLLPVLSTGKSNGTPLFITDRGSVNLADDDELLANMREACFRRVFLGIETQVEESLKHKKQNRGNLLDSVKKIQSYGMEFGQVSSLASTMIR